MGVLEDLLIPDRKPDAETWLWGTVTAIGPLLVRLDGEALALPVSPETLVDDIQVGDRVRCHIYKTQLVVMGKARSASDWAALPLSNSWVAYGGGFGTPLYKKENGIVYVKGLVKSGTTTVNTTIGTLPEGHRPSEIMILTAVQGGNTFARIDITPTGLIRVGSVTDNAFVSLDGIAFPADL